jgi:hypothetical protein
VQNLLSTAFSDIQRPQDQDPRAISNEKEETVTLIPYSFAYHWNRGARSPLIHERPDSIDNSPFLCEHGRLIIDFSDVSKYDPEYALIDQATWDKLCNL